MSMSVNKQTGEVVERTDLATVVRDLGDGTINREATAALETMIAKLRERARVTGLSKKGSLSLKIDLKVTEAGVELSAKVETKTEGIASADVYFTSKEGRLLRTHPKQIELDEAMTRATVRGLRDEGGVRDLGKAGES
jgi:hypothetical protein